MISTARLITDASAQVCFELFCDSIHYWTNNSHT